MSGNLPPVDRSFSMSARNACDQNPLNPADEADQPRLLSYVWADQLQRLERLRAALQFVGAQGFSPDHADAADWVELHFAVEGAPGQVRVLYHTIVWQYLPETVKTRIQIAMKSASERATPDSPVAWFRMEDDGDNRPKGDEGALLDLTVWPGGETQILGRADWHGHWVDWA